MSKQETNKRSRHQGARTSVDKKLRELDAELSRRLYATLDADAKFELEAMRVLAGIAPLEEGSSSSREETATPGEGGGGAPRAPIRRAGPEGRSSGFPGGIV